MNRRKKRLKWMAKTPTAQRAVGKESEVEGVLLTRIGRVPPAYRMEHVRDDGKIMVAMLTKAPKGSTGYHVMLDGEGNGYASPTKKAALISFREMHKTLEAAPISEEVSDE